MCIEWRDYFEINRVVAVKAEEDANRRNAKHKYKLSIMYYDETNDAFEVKRYYFVKEVEFKYAQNCFSSLNLLKRDEHNRYLCIFVNPISGK